MSAWGKNGSARSCDALFQRVEANDAKLTELVVLPLKKFGSEELFRLARCLKSEKNTHLKSLQASGHSIDDHMALEALGEGLGPLETIAIGDSNMGDGGACALCRGIELNEGVKEGTSALKSMDMSYKNIGKEGLNAIIRVLARLQSLQSIDLSRNENIGPSFDFLDSTSSTSLSLPIFKGLTHLDVSGCRLDAKSCCSLLQAMQPDGTDLVSDEHSRNLVLKLNSNNFSDPNHFRNMMNTLARSNVVSELYISSCQIGDEGMKELVDVCCSSEITGSLLQVLDLSNNNITSISSLANRLHLSAGDGNSYLSNMRSLNLSGNTLGQNLVNAIEGNEQWLSSLEELDLSHTSCEVPGAVELIRRSNNRASSLKKLNLFGNKLGSDGFSVLSNVLNGGHLSIEYLDLGGNAATESGVVALVEALKNISPQGEEKDEDCKTEGRVNNALRVLVVGGNKGGPALEKVVKEVEQIHPGIDIARDKPKQNEGGMNGDNMINNTPGLTWRS